jgi:uncharacterized protein
MKPKRNRSGGDRWVRKFDADGARERFLPIPTQVVSNEEMLPVPQTAEQQRVERELVALAERSARRLGVSRREFLSSSTGMAAAFLALNSVFGRVFDVDAAELLEPAASAERWPKGDLIVDVHTHHVLAGKRIEIPPLLEYRKFAVRMGNEVLAVREPAWEDLYIANYVKEIFLDSDTSIAVITGLPAREDPQNVLPPADMVETRAAVNGLARSRRLIAHGIFSPDLGRANLEAMHKQAERLKVEAWKGYPGQPLVPGGRGWRMDDEKVAYPTYEYSRKVGIKNICVHKGLALPDWDPENSSPADVPKAAADFPDLNFLIYHAAFKGLRDIAPAAQDDFKTNSSVPWISDLCAARKKNPKMTNVYMDIGTTFGMLAVGMPRAAAFVLGQMIDAFGEDRILWGTDSIWWGSPQWQIEAMRRLVMPQEYIDRFGFKPLTVDVKRKIFGLNAARVYGIDPAERREALPHDAVTKLKERYRAEGARPSLTQYGWVAG